jgi:anti-sigma B factor antagonist
MATKPRRRRFEMAERDGATVVKFIDPILDEQNSWIIRQQVAELATEPGREKLLLDFGNVKFLSSAALSALLSLHRKVQPGGGRISLCGLAEGIAEVFRATHVDQVFDIR